MCTYMYEIANKEKSGERVEKTAAEATSSKILNHKESSGVCWPEPSVPTLAKSMSLTVQILKRGPFQHCESPKSSNIPNNQADQIRE